MCAEPSSDLVEITLVAKRKSKSKKKGTSRTKKTTAASSRKRTSRKKKSAKATPDAPPDTRSADAPQPDAAPPAALSPARSPADLHLWEFTWLRDILMIAGACLLLYVLYVLRAIVLPVLVGLTLAYLLNPIITKLNKRHGWPRRVIAGGALTVVAVAIALIIALASPLIVDQIGTIVQNRQQYVETIREWKQTIERELQLVPAADDEEGDATSMEPARRAAAPADAAEDPATIDTRDQVLQLLPEPRNIFNFVINSLGIGYSLVSDLIDLTLYLVVFVLVAGMSFFYFSWRYQGIVHWFAQFVPTHHRPRALYIARRMNTAINGFVRGRLIQSLLMAINMGIGLALIHYTGLCEVPSWLLIALAAGALNLIPYAAVVAWLAAIVMAWVGQSPDETSLFAVFFWPTAVYAVAQFLDGWVIEPKVQGSAVDLSGLTIVLAVLVGGTVGGLLGLMIAIPVAACLKIVWEEVWLPQLKQYLEQLP